MAQDACTKWKGNVKTRRDVGIANKERRVRRSFSSGSGLFSFPIDSFKPFAIIQKRKQKKPLFASHDTYIRLTTGDPYLYIITSSTPRNSVQISR